MGFEPTPRRLGNDCTSLALRGGLMFCADNAHIMTCICTDCQVKLASRIGFEPTASAFAGLRSNPLSYRDICYRSVIFLYILAIVRQNLPERECLTGELTQDSALCLDLSIVL